MRIKNEKCFSEKVAPVGVAKPADAGIFTFSFFLFKLWNDGWLMGLNRTCVQSNRFP